MQCILFTIDNHKFGFDLSYIERVILAVEVTPLPHSPPYLLGMINIHGAVVPVVNLRHILGLPRREIEISDQFLICRLEDKVLTLWVDVVSGIVEYSPETLTLAKNIASDLENVDYVVKEQDEILLIYNLKKLLPEVFEHAQNLNS